MTDRAVEIAEFFEAFNVEGVDAALRVFDPEIKWMSPPEWMDQSGYYGHDGLRELAALWRENFDDFTLTLREVRPSANAGSYCWTSRAASREAVTSSNRRSAGSWSTATTG